jgi:hypothetical protein
MEEDNKNLKESVNEINKKFDTLISSGKVKGVKAKKLSGSEKKKGYIRYLYISENKNIKAVKVPVEEGTTFFEGSPRIATPDYMLTWDGDPCIIQPGWSMKPFSPVDNMEQTIKDKMNAVGNRLLLNRIELGAVKSKKGIPGWMIIVGLLLLGGAAYLLLK